MDWKKGDVAVCIKIGPLKSDSFNHPPLRLNYDYIIQNIYQCPKCGEFSFDVGLASVINVENKQKGILCCTERIPCAEIHWCASERFVKKDIRSKEERIEEAIKEEKYELAEQIKNL